MPAVVRTVPDRERASRSRTCRGPVAATLLGLVLLLLTPGTGVAAPPPPPNPSDAEINSSQGAANAKAGEVGRLTNRLAAAESTLADLQDEVELKLEQANKALVDMRDAQDRASKAKSDAGNARIAADAATGEIERARLDVDRFVSGSYQQGSTIGSMSAYVGSDSPRDLLARAQLLDAVGGSKMNALEGMQRAQTDKSNKDAEARKALELARQRQTEAEQAKADADQARTAAEQARSGQAARTRTLEADRDGVRQELYQAQSAVSGLRGQRQRYEDWQAQKQREDEAAARRAALAAANTSSGSPGGGDSGPAVSRRPARAGASVEAVIARGMSKIGLPYAWGGGNGSGPTRGIRDGGVADAYGDYLKIGFDCSGLMIYAFAGVQALPHYSGYQYTSGTQVPLSRMRRGDMIFYGGGGGIHHVALYLGGGQMLEAPQSGSRVKVSAVRYGGIMPYATRLIG